MNHVYRLIWSHVLGAPIAVAETAGSGGKTSSARKKRFIAACWPPLGALLSVALMSSPAFALPHGGRMVAGHVSFARSGDHMTVHQASDKAVINWQSFDIASGQTVTFQQPSVSSIALNRVAGSQASHIYGRLNANGQIFLVNPSGIYFAPGAQVNVGGLVASTLGISNRDFLNGHYAFSGVNKAAVVNAGRLRADSGGYIALLGDRVSNTGTLFAPAGAVALGAGSRVELTLAGDRLLHFAVKASALGALAANGGLIQANGGQVILSAAAKDALLQTVVNNTGVIRARGVAHHGGVIRLLGGASGTTRVSGELDVRPKNGGPGGSLETSGQHISFRNPAVRVGRGGQWLLDPVDLTIGSSMASAISTALNSSNATVTLQTSGNQKPSVSGVGTTASTNSGNGNINVDSPIIWQGKDSKLTLSAFHSINVKAPIIATGSNETLSLTFDNNQGGVSGGGSLSLNPGVFITLSGPTPIFNLNGNSYTVGGNAYRLIQSISALQGMQGNLAGHYVVVEDLYASSNSSFTPIGGSASSPFTGSLNGLGHTISNLVINTSSGNAGLFGVLGSGAVVHNLGLLSESATANGTQTNHAGGLAGSNHGQISNAYALGTVTASGGQTNDVGGLVGYNSAQGTIADAYATGSVSGSGNNLKGPNNVGGLAGLNEGTISSAHAGSIPTANGGTNNRVGGLVGSNNGGKAQIRGSYATAKITASAANYEAGGLVGYNVSGSISNAYAIGNVSGKYLVGGLVGDNFKGSISNAYASGNVSGQTRAGGLVGFNLNGRIANAYSTGRVTASGSNSMAIGGLVGSNYGSNASLSNVYATGPVSAAGSNQLNNTIGGLVGNTNQGSVSNGYWDTDTGGPNNHIGQGKTTAELAGSLSALGFSSSTWANSGGQTTPYLLANQSFATVSGRVYLGSTTSTSPTPYGVIATADQLQNINATGLSRNYVLGNRINASSLSRVPYFSPIGNSDKPFTGTFDGLGHTIDNLTINLPGTYAVGLFGAIGNGGIVRNLGLINPAVTGYARVGAVAGYMATNSALSNVYARDVTATASGTNVGSNYGPNVGGLVGNNAGSITEAYATGTVTGGGNAGGLVGDNAGTISNDYSKATVSGATNIGGLAGDNIGTISNSYATGTATGGSRIGGLVGVNSNSITDAYAAVKVSATDSNAVIGGLVGSNYQGVISTSYWDTTANPGLSPTGGGIGNSNGSNAIGLSARQMEQQSNFAGFDFKTPKWVIYNGHTAPLLNSFLTPVVVSASTNTLTYNGQPPSPSVLRFSVSGAASSGHLYGLSAPYGNVVNAGGPYSPHLWSDQQGYRISYNNAQVTIKPAPLSATIVGNPTKTYDGNTRATLASSNFSLSGFVSGQGATVTQTTGSYASANAGSSIGVSASLSSADFSANANTRLPNYVLPTFASGTGTIKPAPLAATIVRNPTKTYDGNTRATLASSNFSLSGFVSGQGATVTQITGSYASPNAGSPIGVTASLARADFSANVNTRLSNYVLPTSASGTGTIQRAPVTANIVGDPTKTYDGTTFQSLTSNNFSLAGFVNGQGAAVVKTYGNYASANPGKNILIRSELTAVDFRPVSNTQLSNYRLPTLAQGIGTITLGPNTSSGTTVAGGFLQLGYLTPPDNGAFLLDAILYRGITTPYPTSGSVHLTIRQGGVNQGTASCRLR